MLTHESIIPNASKTVRDLERATSFPELGISKLSSLVDPYKIPAEFLPWLAFRFSVDIWRDDWPEEKKRSVIAGQFNLHRLKGTEAGIAGMLAVADSRLLETVAFPQKMFASGTITKEQRNAWLARMPQLRVYFSSERGTKGASGFAGEDGRKAGAYAGHFFARFDAARAIYGRRATIRYPDGSEVLLRRAAIETVQETRQAVEVERVSIPGKAGPAFFAGGFLRGRFVTAKNEQAKLITYRLDRSYDSSKSELHLDTVRPGLDPVDVRYERYSDRGTKGAAFFAGDFIGHGFVTEDLARLRLFDRVILHDPSVDVPWVRAHSFAGHGRIGMKPFHAEMLVDTKVERSRGGFFAGVSFIGRAFATNENLQRAKLAYAAIRRSKAARDRVKVDTQTTRPVKFGDGFKFGDGIKFGTKVRNSIR